MKERGKWQFIYSHPDGIFTDTWTYLSFTPDEALKLIKSVMKSCPDVIRVIAVSDDLDIIFKVDRLEVYYG